MVKLLHRIFTGKSRVDLRKNLTPALSKGEGARNNWINSIAKQSPLLWRGLGEVNKKAGTLAPAFYKI